MKRDPTLLGGGAFAVAAIGVGSFLGIAAATGGGEQALTGQTRDRAEKAAVTHVGGGVVTETETGEGGAAYTVEVRRADGSQVEVQLDASFRVTGTEADDDGPNDKDEGSQSD